MPLYFFDSHDVADLIDDVGTELPDLLTARIQAVQALAEIVLELLPGNGPLKELSIDVRDHASNVVLRARLSISMEPEL